MLLNCSKFKGIKKKIKIFESTRPDNLLNSVNTQSFRHKAIQRTQYQTYVDDSKEI